MKKSTVLLCALLLAVVSVGFVLEPAPEHPAHVERPTAGAAVPLSVVGGDHPGEVEVLFGEWVEGQAREVWFRGVAEAQAVERARSSVRPASVGGGTGSGCEELAAELGLDPGILWRESRCSRDAVNVTGCGGRSCVGAAQVDLGHFREVSPWNSGTSGTCYGLDPADPAQYAECVGRLPASAWGT